MNRPGWQFLLACVLAVTSRPAAVLAAGSGQTAATALGIPVEFILFGLMLLGVAILHHRPLAVALTGLSAIVIYELFVSGFPTGPGLHGLALHLANEWVTFANLLLLLVGFALLSNQFEQSVFSSGSGVALQ